MYFYILDGTNIPAAQFERAQVTLQGLLAEFRIGGEALKVTPLRSINQLVDLASERGVRNLIACGTDETFNIMTAYLQGRDFTLGYVPLIENTPLSKILGVNSLKAAVKTIAARRIERIDLATINDNYFVSQVEFGVAGAKIQQMGWWASLTGKLSFNAYNLKLRIDDSYNMEISCLGGTVTNSRETSSSKQSIANPTDGYLDLMILEKLSKIDVLKYKSDIASSVLENISGTSVIKCRQVEFLEPFGFPLTIAGRVFAKVPAKINIIPRQLKLIVGKNRTF